MFAVLLAAFVVVVLANVRTGVAHDPRIANPNPGPETLNTGVIKGAPFAIGSLMQSFVLFAVLLGISYRQRRLHWVAIIALGAIFTGLVDPIANWATFASLNPAAAHLPTDWIWIRNAPLSEPASAFLGGYASYYLAIGGSMFWLSGASCFAGRFRDLLQHGVLCGRSLSPHGSSASRSTGCSSSRG